MSVHIIIDGYNLIRQSDRLGRFERRTLQAGRDALIDMLAAYRSVRPHRITVVFDGSEAACDRPPRDCIRGVNVIFSRYGELADAVIKRMASVEKDKAVVVSSDRDIARYAAGFGCVTIDSPVFEYKLMMAFQPDEDAPADENSGWIPTTRKKGPSRRLSKRERQKRIKTSKL